MGIEALLKNANIWRGGEHHVSHHQVQQGNGLATGYPQLDKNLPCGGWPKGALTEILHYGNGLGELQLIMPTLVQLTQQQQYIAWIDPPFLPYAPALATAGLALTHSLVIHSCKHNLWTLEQSLRSGTCAAVLGWPEKVSIPQLRRLQLAAETSGACGFLFRRKTLARQTSPATLRILLSKNDERLELNIIKCRGRFFGHPILL